MTNGHDIPANYIIGKCSHCKKSIKNIDRYFEKETGKYVHRKCSGWEWKEGKMIKWAMHFDKCEICKTSKTPHQAKGLCYNCYHKVNNLNGRWAKEHPEEARLVKAYWDFKNRKYRRKKALERYRKLREDKDFRMMENQRLKAFYHISKFIAAISLISDYINNYNLSFEEACSVYLTELNK